MKKTLNTPSSQFKIRTIYLTSQISCLFDKKFIYLNKGKNINEFQKLFWEIKMFSC